MSLTIAIPTYNRGNKLETILSNILIEIQNFNLNISILISDNNSPDNTPSVCYEFKGRFKSLEYFRQETNIGFDQNIYFLYQKCKTDYIWFVSDDDDIVNNSIYHIKNLADNNSLSEVNVFESIDSNIHLKTTHTHAEILFTDINKKNFSNIFFKVIMISTLVLRKRQFSDILFNNIPNSVFPQITLSIMLLRNKFEIKHFDSIIISRNTGYISNNFFKLYCLGPRLAIKNSDDIQFINVLLPETEKSINEFFSLQFQERIGYFISKTPISINLLFQSLKEFEKVILKLKLIFIYLCSKMPRSIAVFIYFIYILVKKRSLKQAKTSLVLLNNHYMYNLGLLESSDV
jgi:hypothetical protein